MMSTTTSTQSTYSISDLSKEFDITTRSIRFYEDQGLIKPKRRGQTRIYSLKDRVRLKLILRGKRLGFSLAETRRLFELYDADKNPSMIKKGLELAGSSNLVFLRNSLNGMVIAKPNTKSIELNTQLHKND